MHDAVRVRTGEGRRHGPADRERVSQRELSLAVETIAQRYTLDEGRHVKELVARRSRIVERKNVGVRELTRDFDLTSETFRAHRLRELAVQQLQGDIAVMLDVASTIHDSGTAATDLFSNLVALREDGTDKIRGRR